MKRLLIATALLLVLVSGSFAQRFTSPFNPIINANSPYWPHTNPPAGNWSDIHSPYWNGNRPGYAKPGVQGSYGLFYNPYYNAAPTYTVPSQ
jgi:hypothetical protein